MLRNQTRKQQERKQSYLSNKKAKKVYLNKIFQVKERQTFTKRLTILPAPEASQVFHQQQQDLFQNPKTSFNMIYQIGGRYKLGT